MTSVKRDLFEGVGGPLRHETLGSFGDSLSPSRTSTMTDVSTRIRHFEVVRLGPYVYKKTECRTVLFSKEIVRRETHRLQDIPHPF